MKRIPILIFAGCLLLLTGCVNTQAHLQGDSTQSDSLLNDSAKRACTATIVFAGDAMQHQGQLDAARRPDGSYDYSGYFTAVEPYIQSADYAVVNLETTLLGRAYAGFPCFSSPDSYAQELKRAGFDMFLTANNHCLDTRDAGAIRTIDFLEGLGVDHIGTYRNAAQRDSLLPKIVDINGIKVGFLNYTYGTNGISVQNDVVVDYIDQDKIKKDIAKAREKGAELICANMHWGAEYVLLPVASEKTLGDFLVDEGVDLIIGGHPHVIQPIEVRHSEPYDKDVLLVYSLGNFISNMTKPDCRGGIMVKATIERDDKGTARFKEAEYLPVIVIRGVKGQSNFRLEHADSVNSGPNAGYTKVWRDNAYRIFDRHNKGVNKAKSIN